MSTRPLKVLCAEKSHYSQRGLEALEDFVDLVAADLDQKAFEARVAEFDAIMVRLTLLITEEMIKGAPRLKAIVTPTTGVDHIALHAAQGKGVKVFSLPRGSAILEQVHSTAEHTWGLLLSVTRRIPSAAYEVAHGRWEPGRLRGTDLHGKTLGIVGCGRVGRKVAYFGRAFGMNVVAFDRDLSSIPPFATTSLDLLDVFSRSHVISLHLPFDDSTRGIIDERLLGCLPGGAVLINTARGELVDEQALIRCLESGRLAGAGLDVLSAERSTETGSHALVIYARNHANLIITPHIGGASEEAIELTDLFMIERFKKWVSAMSSRET